MTFEQFAACVQDWASRLTPAQVLSAAASIIGMTDVPPGSTLDRALALAIVAKGEQPAPVREAKSNGARAPQSVNKRARALLRVQLKHGPKPAAQIEAAAQAAEIPKPVLLAATDALGVRTRRGQWWLPS